MGIESVFRSIAGADFKGAGGDGLSAAEFGAFLKDKAGADGAFIKNELSKVAQSLGLPTPDSNALIDAFGKNGQISADSLRDLLEKSAGSDKAFNLDELKGGLDNLVGKAHDKLADEKDPVADFAKDAGADKAIDKDEFKTLAERAGVDEKTAEKAFDKAAGADGKVSQDEFKEMFGDDKVGKDAFANKTEKLAGDEEKPFAKFGRDAGADGEMDLDEFKALAEKAGVDGKDAEKAFDKMAGADGKISKDEFSAEDGFGANEVSEDDFKAKVEDGADCGCDKKADAADESDETDASGSGEPDDADDCDKPDSGASGDGANSDWSVQNEDGKSTIKLGDKYTITAQEDGEQWIVKNNETGKETKISGDPHVDVGNDGKNDFDFKKDMTFQLDDGTKITVDTIDAGNGTTLSSGLTITNGDNAIKVSGLAGDADGKDNLTVSQSMNGEELDEETEDGLVIDEAGSGWTELATGDVVDQELINRAEA